MEKGGYTVSMIVIIASVSGSSPLNFLDVVYKILLPGNQTVQVYSNFGLTSALYASSFMCADETLKYSFSIDLMYCLHLLTSL